MRYSLAAVFVFLVQPAFAQQNDAEKLFRAMEKTIKDAKSLKVVYEHESKFGQQLEKGSGSLHFAEGNKVRMETKGNIEGRDFSMLTISDGKQMTVHMPGLPPGFDKKTGPAETKFIESIAASVGRIGFSLAPLIMGSESKDKGAIDPDKKMPVSEFKLGQKEKLGEHECQIVEYRIAEPISINVMLWIDTKTMLPSKRKVVVAAEGMEITDIETYTVFTINPQLDPKLFELPK